MSAERLAKQLPNAGATVSRNIRGAEKIVSKTDDMGTTSGTVVPPSEALGRARTLFERANSVAMIADTFSTAVRERMQEGMTLAENADLAVDLLIQSMSEEKQNTRVELRAWREGETNGRTSYWLERTEARFDEVERILEKEVVPIMLAQEKARRKMDPNEARSFAAMLHEKWPILSPLARAMIEKSR